MITFDEVSKVYRDGTVAVSELTLEVPEGEVVVLVGPSGCGKTTTLRIANRMVEPTGGRLYVDGEDALALPAHELRQRIGYVIQQIGLFPHRTIAHNIATVPRLLGWDRKRTLSRVEELIELVGLPEDAADRYPHQLSGGQRQRVGVARALAADPPIMLMDEPFGAVDPIVRTRLQDEFLRLQREVRKTILFVTHDVDEAIRMGDRIAIFNVGGVLEQYDTPRRILAQPANAFVEDFLGSDRGLKRLALISVSEVKAEPGPVVRPTDRADTAAHVAAEHGTDWVVVVDEAGTLHGWVRLTDLQGQQEVGHAPVREPAPTVRRDASLRAALNVMVTSHAGAAILVGEDDRYEGVITQGILAGEIT